MKIDSLKDLESAFAKWRQAKKYAREPMPPELLTRARRAAKKHGVRAVVRVTRVERARLLRDGRGSRTKGKGTTEKPRNAKAAASRGGPVFSRLELSARSEPGVRLLAEVETTAGVRVRVFEATPEMLGLLSAACGFGGVP